VPPQKDQATATGNMHKKSGKDQTCSSEDMIVHRRTQTQIHVHRIPRIPIGAGVTRCTLTYAVQSIAPFYLYQTITICTVSPNMERTYVQRVRKHRTVLEGSSWSASYHCTWCSCRSTEHKKPDTSQNRQQTVYCYLTHTHTHTHLTALCPGLPR